MRDIRHAGQHQPRTASVVDLEGMIFEFESKDRSAHSNHAA
jgi:hypothetical protein